ncbi:hypothetical protein MBLNU459_g7719t2 [Dothideomycetes sp. NU459]
MPQKQHPTMATTTDNAYEAIRNTLARYCIALDRKDFTMLEKVFVKDVDAKYPFGGFGDVAALSDAISKSATFLLADNCHFAGRRLAPVTTQHALTTQTITLSDDANTATATTYFTGVHLGRGKWEGQMVTAYGIYNDELVRKESGNGLFYGPPPQWLVSKREVVFIGRVGEEGVMRGEEG